MYSRMEKYHGRRAQRFSIRKYSFGAASVLLGTALLLGANAVKADETSTASTKTPEVTNSDKQKPDSAIFQKVTDVLHCAPSEILFFDDSETNCEAAEAFGWKALLAPAGGEWLKYFDDNGRLRD